MILLNQLVLNEPTSMVTGEPVRNFRCGENGRLCANCQAARDAGLPVPDGIIANDTTDDGLPEIVADGYMAPPRLDFGAIVANRAKQRSKSQPQPGTDDDYVANADDDGLAVPQMTY